MLCLRVVSSTDPLLSGLCNQEFSYLLSMGFGPGFRETARRTARETHVFENLVAGSSCERCAGPVVAVASLGSTAPEK
jgi:hypothetical protein